MNKNNYFLKTLWIITSAGFIGGTLFTIASFDKVFLSAENPITPSADQNDDHNDDQNENYYRMSPAQEEIADIIDEKLAILYSRLIEFSSQQDFTDAEKILEKSFDGFWNAYQLYKQTKKTIKANLILIETIKNKIRRLKLSNSLQLEISLKLLVKNKTSLQNQKENILFSVLIYLKSHVLTDKLLEKTETTNERLQKKLDNYSEIICHWLKDADFNNYQLLGYLEIFNELKSLSASDVKQFGLWYENDKYNFINILWISQSLNPFEKKHKIIKALEKIDELIDTTPNGNDLMWVKTKLKIALAKIINTETNKTKKAEINTIEQEIIDLNFQITTKKELIETKELERLQKVSDKVSLEALKILVGVATSEEKIKIIIKEKIAENKELSRQRAVIVLQIAVLEAEKENLKKELIEAMLILNNIVNNKNDNLLVYSSNQQQLNSELFVLEKKLRKVRNEKFSIFWTHEFNKLLEENLFLKNKEFTNWIIDIQEKIKISKTNVVQLTADLIAIKQKINRLATIDDELEILKDELLKIEMLIVSNNFILRLLKQTSADEIIAQIDNKIEETTEEILNINKEKTNLEEVFQSLLASIILKTNEKEILQTNLNDLNSEFEKTKTRQNELLKLQARSIEKDIIIAKFNVRSRNLLATLSNSDFLFTATSEYGYTWNFNSNVPIHQEFSINPWTFEITKSFFTLATYRRDTGGYSAPNLSHRYIDSFYAPNGFILLDDFFKRMKNDWAGGSNLWWSFNLANLELMNLSNYNIAWGIIRHKLNRTVSSKDLSDILFWIFNTYHVRYLRTGTIDDYRQNRGVN